jgi:hypothetical protein
VDNIPALTLLPLPLSALNTAGGGSVVVGRLVGWLGACLPASVCVAYVFAIYGAPSLIEDLVQWTQ